MENQGCRAAAFSEVSKHTGRFSGILIDRQTSRDICCTAGCHPLRLHVVGSDSLSLRGQH